MTNIDFTTAVYTLAAHLPSQWPADIGTEVAFAGRSNVGKSSAINAITNQNRLARCSKTPGRTRQIIFFDLSTKQRLVDLPGYGYAKVPEELRRHWELFISNYLTKRACLKGVVVVMDIRRPLTTLDQTMLRCCWENNLHAHVLLTKADKLTRQRANTTLQQVRGELQLQSQTTVQLFSATKRQEQKGKGQQELQGVVEAREAITELLLS